MEIVPKLIDHDQRRRELAEAVWRVIVREGVGAVSVRSVAAEAGVSTGSLRHVLPTKSGLLAAAMGLVIDNATERFLAHPHRVATVAQAVAWLSEMLPLDAQRRVELQIQLALVAEAAGHPDLRALLEAPGDAVRRGCQSVLALGVESGLFRAGLDLEDEATRLHVLLDGLAFHLVGGSSAATPELARQLLTEHLDELRRPPEPQSPRTRGRRPRPPRATTPE
jgi:AcrR family transcriptional regulator